MHKKTLLKTAELSWESSRFSGTVQKGTSDSWFGILFMPQISVWTNTTPLQHYCCLHFLKPLELQKQKARSRPDLIGGLERGFLFSLSKVCSGFEDLWFAVTHAGTVLRLVKYLAWDFHWISDSQARRCMRQRNVRWDFSIILQLPELALGPVSAWINLIHLMGGRSSSMSTPR